MQPLDAGRLCVRQRGVEASLEVVEPRRQRGKTLLAGVPVTRRQVEQRLRQAVAFEPLAYLFGRMVIGKQKFDGGKSRFRSSFEAVEERDVVEHHREVGGKARHVSVLLA